MKKYITPPPAGGVPIYGDEAVEIFQTDIYAVVEGMLSGYGNGIVSGSITPNASNFCVTRITSMI